MIKDDTSVIQPTLAKLKEAFKSGKTRSVEFRKQQLRALVQGLKENADKIHTAHENDLGYKNKVYTQTAQVSAAILSIEHIIDNVEKWAKPRSKDTNIVCGNATSSIVPEPYGTVLVIGAWNYPIFTAVGPAAEAIAAGNCVCVKPSEMAASNSNLIREIFDRYLDKSCYAVIEGGPLVAEQITRQLWDLIIFTGSPQKGKLVARAAAENLVPCILELGGKNPTIIDSDANIESAALRIASSKFMNCGQTCIAPDYIFCHSTRVQQFVDETKKQIKVFYGDDVKSSNDYSRIINDFHTKRIAEYIDEKDHKGKVVFGGKFDVKEKFIEPTLILEPSKDSKVMRDEIFGPVLPILKYDNLNEVIEFINANQKPLSLYYYGDQNKKLIEERTSSGAYVVNDCIVHILNHQLPFGGVGYSGQMSLHGEIGFNNCSHLKPVMYSDNFNGFPANVRFPPFTESKGNILAKVARFGNVYKKELTQKVAAFVLLGAVFFSAYTLLAKKGSGEGDL